VKSRFNCADVSTEFLIDAVVSLRNYLVGIVDETAAKTRCPSSSKATTFSPTMHAFAIRWHFCMMLIFFWKFDMFRFSVQSITLIVHLFSLQIDLHNLKIIRYMIDKGWNL